MAKAKSPTRRLNLTLSLATIRYLERLAGKGTHGISASDVAKTLVEEVIRNAIERRFIEPDDQID